MKVINKEQVQQAITDLSRIIVKGSGKPLSTAEFNAIIRARIILSGLLKQDGLTKSKNKV